MAEKGTLIATVGTPNDTELGKAIGQIQAEIPSRKLRAMTVTVVTEMVSNLRDHGEPPVGEVRVYLQDDHGIQVVSEGEASASHMRALLKKIGAIVKASPRAKPLLRRLTTRSTGRRNRGRGLYWIAENATGPDGQPDVSVSQQGNHFVISARLSPLAAVG